MALFLTEKDVNDLLNMDVALGAVEEGFRLLAEGKATNIPRARLRFTHGTFNFMSAAAPTLGVVGQKTYAVASGNPVRFYVQISSADTGELLALFEASAMGQIRTGAATGVATKHMARRDASTVGLIGAGYQARTQLEAVCRVRDVRSVRVFSPTPERRERFAAEMSAKLGVEISTASSAEACVRDADIAITITSSSRPVMSGEWLSPGTHVNAAGANHRMRRELDDEAVRRSNTIVADDVEQAKIECGDLIHPIERGLLQWEQVRNLSAVVAGREPGRTSDGDVTLFESQGLALEDIVTGIKVYQLAREGGIGQEIPS